MSKQLAGRRCALKCSFAYGMKVSARNAYLVRPSSTDCRACEGERAVDWSVHAWGREARTMTGRADSGVAGECVTNHKHGKAKLRLPVLIKSWKQIKIDLSCPCWIHERIDEEPPWRKSGSISILLLPSFFLSFSSLSWPSHYPVHPGPGPAPPIWPYHPTTKAHARRACS